MTIPATIATGGHVTDPEIVDAQLAILQLLLAFTNGVLNSANGGTGSSGGAVTLQASTPGTAQTGNFNIDNTGRVTHLQCIGDTPLLLQRAGTSQGKNSGILFKDQGGSPKDAIGVEGVSTNDLQIMAGDGIGSGGAIRFYTNSDLVSTNERGRFDAAGLLILLGGLSVGVVSKTANYGAGSTDYLILCNATTGIFTITLPAATKTGQILAIVKTDASINAVTVARAGADTIEGGTTKALALQYDKVTLIADGTSTWYDLGKGLI